jgi:hypothetical protein
MIDQSRICDSIAFLICIALVLFMIYPLIKIKLKVLIFPTRGSHDVTPGFMAKLNAHSLCAQG